MSRILVCIISILCLVSCNTKTYSPNYPLTVSSKLCVEGPEYGFEADFNFKGNVATFTVTSPEELSGMKLSVTENTVCVTYDDLCVDYERKTNDKFTAFTNLYDVLKYVNNQEPQFNRNGSIIEYTFLCNNIKGAMLMDADTHKLEEIDFDKVKYIFS